MIDSTTNNVTISESPRLPLLCILGDTLEGNDKLANILESNFEIRESMTVQGILDQSIESQPRIIILTGMPSNASTLNAVAELRRTITSHIIVIKDQINPHMWHELVKSGIQYIFRKPIQVASILNLCNRLLKLDQAAHTNPETSSFTKAEGYYYSLEWKTKLGESIEELLFHVRDKERSFLLFSKGGAWPNHAFSILARSTAIHFDATDSGLFLYLPELKPRQKAIHSILEKHFSKEKPTSRIILSADKSAAELIKQGILPETAGKKLKTDQVELPSTKEIVDDLPTFAQWWGSVTQPTELENRIRISERAKEWLKQVAIQHDWDFILSLIEGACDEARKRSDLVRKDDLINVRRKLLFGAEVSKIPAYPIYLKQQIEEYRKAIAMLKTKAYLT